MICPRCSVSEISPVSGKCDLCGYSVVAAVALASADHVGELAARQLEHEFTFGTLIGRSRESVVQRATENGSGRAVVVKAILRGNGLDAQSHMRAHIILVEDAWNEFAGA